MKILYALLLILFFGFSFNLLFAKSDLPGKEIFYTAKGKYGSCNNCHVGGGSGGRWNFETQHIDTDEGKKIPVLKGIGKRKNPEQIERAIGLMKRLFNFKLTDEQISQLAEYLGTI